MAAEAADSNMLITGQQSSALCVLVMCSDSKAMWNWKLTAVHVNLNLLRGKRQVENSLWLRCYRVIMNLLAPSDEVRQLISINADFNRRPSRSVFTSKLLQSVSSQEISSFLHRLKWMNFTWTYLFFDKTAKQLFTGRTVRQQTSWKCVLLLIITADLIRGVISFHFTSRLWTHVTIPFCFYQRNSYDTMSRKRDTVLVLYSDLRSSSSPISTPASCSMATASLYSSLRVGSRNLKGSLGNCLFTVWISVWKLTRRNTQ